jgi:hypothetical protein
MISTGWKVRCKRCLRENLANPIFIESFFKLVLTITCSRKYRFTG